MEMNWKTDRELLESYRRKINDGVWNNIRESISRLNETGTMLNDMQEIGNAMLTLIEEQKCQIDTLNGQLTDTKTALAEKEKKYDAIMSEAFRVVQLYNFLQEKSKELKEKKERLESEQEKFEWEKKALSRTLQDYKERNEKLSEDRDAAIHSRDEAIAEKDKLIAANRELNEENENLEIRLMKKKEELIECKRKLKEYREGEHEKSTGGN